VRIALLLAVLTAVALDAWLTRTRTTSWERTLRVSVYPIAGDDREATRRYVAALAREDFAPIEGFLQSEASRYGVTLAEPARLWLRPRLDRLPPLPPRDRSLLGTMGWSLKLRWFTSVRERAQPRPRGQVRIFVLYYDPETSPTVAHSLGLKEGLIGIVHAFATRSMTQANNVVIAHELLHTLVATDKYDAASGLPRYPEGYAEPALAPRYPQAFAELMAGRIPRTARHAEIPEGLEQVRVGPLTASEIGWTNKGSDPFSRERP
jgi:hypothetical protein